ncbi:MAG: hypothetical protein PHO92_04315 [Candidatus Peribacteraceae bacterium]|nr:hypothetical protein [Candidatus Peribacteraceae bacterium]
MFNGMPRNGYIEDPRSPEYDRLSEQYADLWSGNHPDSEHYLNIRKAYMEWCLTLRDDGIRPNQGSAVLLGPGFSVAQNRELEPGWVHVHLAEHPRLIVADFSRVVLDDAFRSLAAASRRMKPENMRLIRRDFSGGLSARFEALIGSRLDGISNVEQFQDFMKWLEDEVRVEEVARQSVTSGCTREGNPDVMGMDPEQLLCFKNIVQNAADVRMLITNGGFSGAFYTTEDAFREKLMLFAEQDPQRVTRDHVRMYMRIWHDLITDMVDEVTVNALQSFAQAHPEGHIFCTLDKSASYDGLDDYPRLNLDRIRARLAEFLSIHVAHTWTLDDSAQTPPHRHNVAALWASPVSYDDDEEDAAPPEGQETIQ